MSETREYRDLEKYTGITLPYGYRKNRGDWVDCYCMFYDDLEQKDKESVKREFIQQVRGFIGGMQTSIKSTGDCYAYRTVRESSISTLQTYGSTLSQLVICLIISAMIEDTIIRSKMKRCLRDEATINLIASMKSSREYPNEFNANQSERMPTDLVCSLHSVLILVDNEQDLFMRVIFDDTDLFVKWVLDDSETMSSIKEVARFVKSQKDNQ